MPPLFNEIIARVAQGVSRRVIELDDQAQAVIAPVAGRVVEVLVEPLGLQFFVIGEQANIIVLDTFEGEPDATVRGRPTQFIHVLRAGGSANAVRESGIRIDGDLEVVEAFASVAESLDPDFEDYLSRFIGDGPARKLGLTARRFRRWFDTTSEQVTEDAGYYLREDSGVLVTEQELREFTDDVDGLRADTDRIEQRIERLRQSRSS